MTGLCNRQSCPLANSRYATVREKDGKDCHYQAILLRASTEHCPLHLPAVPNKNDRENNKTKTSLNTINLLEMPKMVMIKFHGTFDLVMADAWLPGSANSY